MRVAATANSSALERLMPAKFRLPEKLTGYELLLLAYGVRYISPSSTEASPMVTMITLMIGCPTIRRRKKRSITIPRKKVSVMAIRAESQKFRPRCVRASAINAPTAIS